MIRSRYLQTQPLFDRAQRLWLWAFLAALFFFMLAAEHWGFRIAVGGVVLIGFFVYLGLV